MLKKTLLLLTIAALIFVFWAFDLSSYLSLESLKSNRASLVLYYQQHKIEVTLSYFLIYIATTALSLPGATVLTLAGGALLGLWIGVLVVSFASTIGATLAFMLSRFLFRDALQSRFADKLNIVNQGIAEEGTFYLFTLRLVPLFPFFLINILMGLTPISVLTFFVVSQVGMLPGTFAYVNAGTQLSEIDSLSGILSFDVIMSFVILGCLPLVSKKLISFIKRQRA